jgi:hypothetical protein
LEQLDPDNRHIRDKIRQQLQVLRDAKLLIHVGMAFASALTGAGTSGQRLFPRPLPDSLDRISDASPMR